MIKKHDINKKLLLSSINSIDSYIKTIKNKKIFCNDDNHHTNNRVKCKCGFWGNVNNNLCSICFKKKIRENKKK